jgi:type II secretory pathway component GspD/PulD (secretin)
MPSRQFRRPIAGDAIFYWILGIVLLTLPSRIVALGQAPTAPISAPVALNGDISLASLVQLCAARGHFEVEYSEADLQAKVVIRVEGELSDDELWALTNELLAANGLASVRRPGSRILSIVKAADAAAAARVERDISEAKPPEGEKPADVDETGHRLGGYRSVVLRVKHRDAKEAIDAIKPVLSKQTGTVAAIVDGGLILVTDYAARIEQATYLLSMIDLPSPENVIETVPARYVRAQELVTAVTAALAAKEEGAKSKLRGKAIATADGSSVILSTPASELSSWKLLVEAFDRPPMADTHTYLVRGFGMSEVSQLIEASCRDAGPQGSGQRWKVVVDDLTGTLIVTATPSEHAAIDALLGRLAAAPQDARQQVRTFVVRNRPVREVMEVLGGLLDATANADDVPSSEGGSPSGSPDGVRSNSGGASSLSGTTQGRSATTSDSVVLSTPPPSTPRSLTPPSFGSRDRSGSSPSHVGSGSLSGAGSGLSSGQGGGGAGVTTLRRDNLTLTADEGTNALIVAAEPRLMARIDSLLKTVDVRQPQVMIEALVVSLTDDQSLDLGVELSKLEVSGSTIASLSSLFGLSQLSASSTSPPASGTGGTGVVLRPGDFSVLVRALETLSKGRSLNIPKAMVFNNRQASLSSVLQQPVLSTNASDTVATTSFSGTQDAGTVITVTPQIAEGDHLLLDYSVEISSFVGDSADPALPPPRQQNQLKSVVAIPDSHVVAVGGLQIENDVQGTSQVPLLGSIPIIGEAFKSRSNTRTRSRFFVFIRAEIMRQGDFLDLKYLSDKAAAEAGIDDGFPVSEPRVIK